MPDGTAAVPVVDVAPRNRCQMPAFIAPLLGFVLGIVFAWSALDEIASEPASVLGSRSLLVSALFGVLVFAPAAGYFAVFDPDWAFAYLINARHIPSAVVLGLVILDALVVPAGFLLAAPHARRRRLGPTLALAGVPSAVALIAMMLLSRRLGVAGSYEQFQGDFGTRSVAGTELGYALVWVDGVLALAISLTVRELRRLSVSARHAGQEGRR